MNIIGVNNSQTLPAFVSIDDKVDFFDSDDLGDYLDQMLKTHFDVNLQTQGESEMKYKIALSESEEGYSVSCPSLPGCWSQGATKQKAIDHVQDAIEEYLATVEEFKKLL